MTKIWLVTHGDAEKDKSNPSLTKEGKAQMEERKNQLPKVDYVISGISKRCIESCIILTGEKAHLETEKAGVSEALSSDRKRIIFPDGEEIPLEEYMTSLEKKLVEIKAFLNRLLLRDEEKILLVGGRIAAIAIGISREKVRSGCLYLIERTSSGISITENPNT